MKSNRILIVAWSLERKGGIQEVCYQVHRIFSGEPDIEVSLLLMPRGIAGRVARLEIWRRCLSGYRPMFMHPFLFECVPRKRAFARRFRPWVWAYGIEVWGEYGKRSCPNLHLAGKVITISRFTDDQVRANWTGIVTEIVHLGCEVPDTPPAPKSRDGFRIITVGRLDASERYKGHDLVLEALALLRDEGCRISYDIVGDGDDLPRLKGLASSLELEDQVVFHGFLPSERVAALMDSASWFVMPSKVERPEGQRWSGEGFGLVYVEAALRGLPSIACDEGGQTDFIEHGVNGFLVKPSASAVAEAVRCAMRNEDATRAMGEAARMKAAMEFGLEDFRRRLLAATRSPDGS